MEVTDHLDDRSSERPVGQIRPCYSRPNPLRSEARQKGYLRLGGILMGHSDSASAPAKLRAQGLRLNGLRHQELRYTGQRVNGQGANSLGANVLGENGHGKNGQGAFEAEFLTDVLTGLQASPKSLPSKYLYDERGSRLFDEISLVSCCQQQVAVGEETFLLEEDEAIITEYSHKYTIEGFASLAAEVGLTLRRSWTDDKQLFAVLHFALLS